MTALHDLYEKTGQSAWIDDLKRSYIEGDELRELIESGIRGLTSNPTIMASSIAAGSDYDAQFKDLLRKGISVDDCYWELVIYDIMGALELMRPIHEQSNGGDGFVSLEVAPRLARDTKGTIESARLLHERIDRPNLLVKIPATEEGIPAIREMIGEGRSINVTLIFSLERYGDVVDAYLSGLEHLADRGGDLSKVASVASFFVSRVDTAVDRLLPEGSELLGKAALAQARLAYRHFEAVFSSPRFEKLRALGARVQRPLWASTSTKNPAYPDLLYVEGLIAPHTVDTMPAGTVKAFLDHGKVRRTIEENYDAELSHLDQLSSVGVSLDDVSRTLETEGIDSFSASFDHLMAKLEEKAKAL